MEDWKQQTLRVTPPWGGEPLKLKVPAGERRIRGVLARPDGDEACASTGTYVLHVDRPYNPAETGLRGYAPDLGVLMRRIIIRIEPSGSSVPN